jgi:hypothetical protein
MYSTGLGTTDVAGVVKGGGDLGRRPKATAEIESG